MDTMTEAPAVQPQPPARASGPTPRRRALGALVILTGLLLGLGIAFLVFREPPRPSVFDGPPSVQSIDLPASGSSNTTAPAAPEAAEIAEPRSARAALEQYLRAEIDRRYDVSFALLDASTREAAGTVTAWQSERPNRLLPETFVLRSEKVTETGTEIILSATRAPAVTTLAGLVPARSEETWRVTNTGGWRVVGGRPVEVRPVLPPDTGAAATAAQWLDRAAACDPAGATALQLSASLLGSPDLRDVPCTTKGEYRTGAILPVGELPDTTVFVSAFGPSVGRWGRAVPVTGSGRFTIVLAPLGDDWRVMGVVPDGSPRP